MWGQYNARELKLYFSSRFVLMLFARVLAVTKLNPSLYNKSATRTCRALATRPTQTQRPGQSRAELVVLPCTWSPYDRNANTSTILLPLSSICFHVGICVIDIWPESKPQFYDPSHSFISKSLIQPYYGRFGVKTGYFGYLGRILILSDTRNIGCCFLMLVYDFLLYCTMFKFSD